jgi:hypothetical protein
MVTIHEKTSYCNTTDATMENWEENIGENRHRNNVEMVKW